MGYEFSLFMEKGENTIIIHVYRCFEDTIKAINFYINSKTYFIDVKKIRKHLNIESSNRSKINFIFRNLDVLAEHGFIEKLKTSKTYSYKLPRNQVVIRYKKEINIFVLN